VTFTKARGRLLKWIPRRLDEGPHAFRGSGVAQQDAVHSGAQHLLDHPRIGPHRRLIGGHHRQRHDHGRRPVAAARRASVHQTLHERTQRADVEGAVLHFVVDVVGPRLGHLLPLVVSASAGGCVVDRLALLQEFHSLVDVLRFVRLGAEQYQLDRQQ
jgi:hypothetical protein